MIHCCLLAVSLFKEMVYFELCYLFQLHRVVLCLGQWLAERHKLLELGLRMPASSLEVTLVHCHHPF